MAIEQLREQLKIDLSSVTYELVRAQSDAATANERVTRLQTEQRVLQAASDALDGKITAVPMMQRPNPSPGLWSPAQSPLHLTDSVKTTLNGEEIMLEPGFKIFKDAEGYETLVPDLESLPPAPQPLPPIPTGGLSDGFVDPTTLV